MNSNLTISRPLNVFLAHAQEDKPIARKIFSLLNNEKKLQLSPWLDVRKLMAGDVWEREIKEVITNSDVTIILFSNSLIGKKDGFIFSELRMILETESRKPHGSNFVIPIRLDGCNIPEDFRKWQYSEYGKSGWYKRLLVSLENRAQKIGINIASSNLKEKLLLIVDINFKDFDEKRKKRFLSSLAQKLNVNIKDIKIVSVTKGSVKILMEMPRDAIRHLYYLRFDEDPELDTVFHLIDFVKFDDQLREIDVLTTANSKKYSYTSSKIINRFTSSFIGREAAIEEFEKLLLNPYGRIRILFLLGDGGIGKTKLVEKMLEEARELEMLAPVTPIDLSVTEYRSIDGIQLKIIEIIEELTGLSGEDSPFAIYFKNNQGTTEQFILCLKEFCKNTPLILAFDTFEMLDTVASNWLFSWNNDGLQVPGLICIVAGRPQKAGLDNYLANRLVKNINLRGLTLSEINKLYRIHSVDVSSKDSLDFWGERGKEDKIAVPTTLKLLQKVTNGHPLRVEMALNWSDVELSGIKEPQTFEKKMMEYVSERGEKGDLNVGSMVINQAVFDTLACMGMITRRFDERILNHLIDEGYIRYGKKKNISKDILTPLEKYFFVKARTGDFGEQAYQLHDEMARLVQKYVWSYRDPSSKERKALLKSIIQYYEWKIESTKDVILRKNLQIEHLYYTFKLDSFSSPIGNDGYLLWFQLADLGDDYINSYLPSEIKEYKSFYNIQSQYEIHARIAQIEYDAGHITQAQKEWEQVLQLGRETKQNDWIAAALFSLANCERDSKSALKVYRTAMRFCKMHAHDSLPRVYYEIGFTYRRMQNVEKAIEWYKKAQKVVNPKDKTLTAQITNDLGYAYSYIGKWEESRRNIKAGQKIRNETQLLLEQEVKILESKLKATKNKKACADLNNQLTLKKNLLSRARFQLGLSHNTLGEIYRYRGDLIASLRNYDTALALFEMDNNYRWQAKALSSRGETLRRIAWVLYRDRDEKEYEAYLTRAERDIDQSLYICEKYRIKEERDTANRRMGRVLHDRALHALERKKRKEARILLERAWERFAEGLRYAKDTGDDLEILSNQTELAFLYDDFVRAMGQGSVPQKYRDAMKDLKRVLDEQRNKPYRIYQFEVFENEYKLEEAAIAYQAGRYSIALKKYLEGYVGLASDPGYGRTRYKSLFPHLAGQIEKLPRVEAAKWCRAFIAAWQMPRGVGRRKVRLEREAIFPDMVQWCWAYLEKNTGV